MTTEWSVDIEARPKEDILDLDEYVDRLLEALEDHGPAVARTGRYLSVRFDVEAETLEGAFHEALGLFVERIPDLEPVRFEADRVEDLNRELAESNAPDLVGVSELAALLSVSRQRASELAHTGNFPEPLAELKSGPIWRRSTIARYVDEWPRRGGRPRRKSAS